MCKLAKTIHGKRNQLRSSNFPFVSHVYSTSQPCCDGQLNCSKKYIFRNAKIRCKQTIGLDMSYSHIIVVHSLYNNPEFSRLSKRGRIFRKIREHRGMLLDIVQQLRPSLVVKLYYAFLQNYLALGSSHNLNFYFLAQLIIKMLIKNGLHSHEEFSLYPKFAFACCKIAAIQIVVCSV